LGDYSSKEGEEGHKNHNIQYQKQISHLKKYKALCCWPVQEHEKQLRI